MSAFLLEETRRGRLNRFPTECLTRQRIKQIADGDAGRTSMEIVHLQNCRGCRDWYMHYNELNGVAK